LSSSNCPDGQMAKGDGASCVLCPLGRAGLGGSCPACRPGTTADKEGMTQCESCPKGHYNAGVGGVECFACAPGSYADNVGTDQCTLCPRGHASSKTGATEASDCAPCGKRQYASQIGSTSCTACGAGTAHDLYAMWMPETCTRCDYCGHDRGGGLEGPCPLPKSNPGCVDCPDGMVISTPASCEYCPVGEFPTSTSAAASCGRFSNGDFNAVPDTNSRECYTRDQYAGFNCPVTEDGGWGTRGKPGDDDMKKHLTLTADENEACSKLVCMGAFYELNEIAARQSGECPADTSFRDLCEWSKARLNEDINERETAARTEEEARELAARQEKLRSAMDGCKDFCEAVTASEDEKEDAFEVLPFKVTECRISGLTVHYTCTSERPAKSVEGTKNGLTYDDVREVVVQRTTLPRCEATCSQCPKSDGRYRVDSFEPCDSHEDPFPAWAAVLIAIACALVIGAIAWLARRRCQRNAAQRNAVQVSP